MAFSDVCRLCLATDNLVHVFDAENKKLNMKDIISVSTGIEIHTKDIISQKICEKCYQFSIQIFQFRGQCLKADKYLKGLCMDYHVDKKYYIPNTEVTIKGIAKNEEEHKPEPIFTKQSSNYEIHPSILKLSLAYPKMKLPRFCISLNLTPIVEMEMDHVENYFKRLNLDFNLCVKNALSHPLLALSKEITITQISQPDKDPLEDSNGICKTPARSHLRYPSLSNIRRKLMENSLKENIEKTKEQSDTRSITHNSRKRKLNTADKSLQERAPNLSSERIVFREADTTYSNNPAKRRRKLLLKENFSNERADDFRPIPLKSPRKLKQAVDRCNIETNSFEEPAIQEIPSNNISETQNNFDRNTDSANNFRKNHLSENEDYESLTSVGRSVPLFVCEICNSVQYSMCDLTKHMNKHMRCQFCKSRFRSIESKTIHIENSCIIRKMMNDVPYVELIKVERNKQTRQSYPEAFVGFSPLPHAEESRAVAEFNDNSLDEPFFRGFPREKEIIEISSDEEAPSFPPTPKKEYPPIIPDIRSNVLANLGSKAADQGILKNILTMFQLTLKELETQTNLPAKSDITVADNFRAILKNLMPFMATYNVFVKIQPGEFNVTYDYNLKSSSAKKMCLWNDLTPIDIKSDSGNCDASKGQSNTK